ncbi:glycoside hydrolase family 2 [bacterium]|nr:glycoside hydrolase family 2 [bacterium]
MRFRREQPEVDLCGEWSFAYVEGEPQGQYRCQEELQAAGLQELRAQVPGNFELDLQANGIIEEPFYGMNMAKLFRYETAHVWYWRRFKASEVEGMDAELVFEGVDCFAEIYLNGELIGECDNMLVEHVFPVGGKLKEDNEVFVHLRPALEEARKYDYPPHLRALGSNYDSLYVRKAPHMYGWDIMPRAISAGLWRPVRLQLRPVERLERVYLQTQSVSTAHSSADLLLCYDAKTIGKPEDVYEIALQGVCGDSEFQARSRMLFQAGRMHAHVSKAKLWWPAGRGEANLYTVTATMYKNGVQIDQMQFEHGLRKVALDRTSTTDELGRGEFCFRVNGEKLFAKGSNWVPADAYHSRDAQRIPQMLEMAEDLRCNMIRCWGGNVYEDDLFYEICDRKGILIWQDFALACTLYPQDAEFQKRLEQEARKVVQRLRQHPCIALWSGDNECDAFYKGLGIDPNTNVLTRKVLPQVVAEEDGTRPYLGSSPYIDEEAVKQPSEYLSENHLWGPRDYYKSNFYTRSLCHFASEMGYHGCPAPESLRRFISPEKVWPYQNNEEWLLHASNPVPGVNQYEYRIELMAKQIRELFGTVPDNLDDFAFASQASQAEAKKFFIEMFRCAKWRRTGILWWNLIDGWPQFSDAIVDYYFVKKLAYGFIKRAQEPLLVALREPGNWGQDVVACNDGREDLRLKWRVRDVDTDEVMAQGEGVAPADATTNLGRVPFSASWKRMYVIEWETESGKSLSHYLAGNPPFELEQYRAWLSKAGLV